jgi:solute carrier family 34 (sodium-dependent phosphate cotransporter)
VTITAKPVRRPPTPAALRLARFLTVIALLFIFLLGVKGLGEGFKLVGRDLVETFFRATANPFVGLIIGILATTLVQSSSVSTSMIVGLVAAPENPLPLANAIPMIMGANIGTTVTNTLVSLAHIGRKEEFRRAFSAATCHDFFNYLAVVVLLPIELFTGYLRWSAESLAELLVSFGTKGVTYESPLEGVLRAGFTPVKAAVSAITGSSGAQATLLVLISGIFIFSALISLVRIMRTILQSRVEVGVVGALGQSGLVALAIGMIVTIMVQSSSITTSLLIPLAGAGIVTLEQVFPITIGANIGTTVTALLASLAATGPNAMAGLTIALVHLIFNISASLLIYGIPQIRRIPLAASRTRATVATRSRSLAIFYVIGIFYVIPAIVAIIDLVFFGS